MTGTPPQQHVAPNAAGAANPGAFGSAVDPRDLNYEDSDLNAITRRQMNEDINAYRYDLDFCRNHLSNQPDLTPQETRTLQIRILDCGHNIRHCQHRIEQLDAQARNAAYANSRKSHSHYRNVGNPGSGSSGIKRQRIKKDTDEDAGVAAAAALSEADLSQLAQLAGTSGGAAANTMSVQRLGFWKCRLCTSQKYLDAGANRVPSEPGKWPLKDVSKMLNHFLDMHTEHAPDERCRELGDALAQNRGPFEYWLTRTRSQDLDDLAVIDDYIEILQSGALPEPLRNLNRAAAAFPNTVAGAYQQK
ncbi:hypothetical protein F4810DRAFT_703615 [Camillea tinctor]|nr:hypothetical protein F4810DRAFT_703615 [Camillea tinctor]